MSVEAFQNNAFRFAHVCGQQVSWKLTRNCSITPAQLGWLYLSLCVVSFVIATVFWLHGAWMIMPIAGLELIAVGIAFLFYARHATDGERLVLHGSQLLVERCEAGKISRSRFDRQIVRVEPWTDDRSLIELSGQGRRVRVGRFVRPEYRALLARELRFALRASP